VGNKAKTLLQCLTSAYFEEKSVNNTTKYPRILLLGNSCSAYAHAIHNSMGNVSFVELSADFVSQGLDSIVDVLRSCGECDTIYISECNTMSIVAQNILYKYLKFSEVEVFDFFERKKEVIKVPDLCLILGATTRQGLSRSLYKFFCQ